MARSSKIAERKNRNNSSAQLNIDIQIEQWPIEQLTPRANNPHTHSRAQVASIAARLVSEARVPILRDAPVRECIAYLLQGFIAVLQAEEDSDKHG